MSKGRSIIPAERKLNSCLNCGHTLREDNFCPRCGQENTDRNISFWTLIRDFLGDYFTFDSKLFQTMFPLIIHPGRVPQEFIEGKRVKHIPPLRILIFTSFIFFFVWGISFQPEVIEPKDLAAQMNQQFQEGLEQQVLTGDSTIRIGIEGAHLTINGTDSLEKSSTWNKVSQLRDLIDQGVGVNQAVDSVASDNSSFEKRLYTQMAKMYTSDQGTIAKYFISNLSVIILVMQPFFALLLKLLYIRRSKKYRFIQHLVFSLYYHGWMLLMATMAILINEIYEGFNSPGFVSFLAIIYLPIAIKKFYGQSWIKTLVKTFLIFLLYIGLIIPFFLILSLGMSFYFF